MIELTPDGTAILARAAGLPLPADRLAVVTDALNEILALAATLTELPLTEVEPLQGPPTWE